VTVVFCRAMLCKRGLCRHAVSVCVSVTFMHLNGMAIFQREPPPPLTGAWNADGVGRNRYSEQISLHAVNPAASCDTLLVVAAVFVDGRKGRRNVCDKKFQRYAKDSRTAFNCMQ